MMGGYTPISSTERLPSVAELGGDQATGRTKLDDDLAKDELEKAPVLYDESVVDDTKRPLPAEEEWGVPGVENGGVL